jgi:hypothetical protein
MTAVTRTLHVRCTTWEQVEAFYTRKLRKGKLLSMKVPFPAELGAPVMLGLELPNLVVISIEGKVQKSSPVEGDGGKTWIELELIGFTDAVIARIKAMAVGETLPDDPTPPPMAVPPQVAAAAPVAPASSAVSGAVAALTSAVASGPVAAPVAAASAVASGRVAVPVAAASAVASGRVAVPAIPAVPAPVSVSVPASLSGPVVVHAPAPVPPAASGPITAPRPIPVPVRRSTTLPPVAPPPPSGHELPSDERLLFNHLTSELRRLRQLAVHEVLDVDRDADADAIRIGWMKLVRRHHPDLVARHQAPAVTHLAEELTILCNRAYDRLRAAMVLEGRATSAGSVLQQPAGWLVGFDDISSREASVARMMPRPEDDLMASVPMPLTSTPTQPLSVVQGGEAFETRARVMLSGGDAHHAQEVLAAALCVYPRSRPLRSLYYVASALAALMKGEVMLATSQLETALAHHEQCVEAAQILEHLKRYGDANQEELRRYFR